MGGLIASPRRVLIPGRVTFSCTNVVWRELNFSFMAARCTSSLGSAVDLVDLSHEFGH